MPLTIIGPPASTANAPPEKVVTPLIAIKRSWSNSWLFFPPGEYDLLEARRTTAEDLDSLSFVTRYGSVKLARSAATFQTVRELDLLGQWVRLDFANSGGLRTQWVGQITNESREMHARLSGRSGIQQWTAYGGLQLLQKRYMGKSRWDIDGEAKLLGWIPGFNTRDVQEQLVGNRSSGTYDNGNSFSTHVFGGTDTWTRLQALEYVLAWFADEGGSSGPRWRVSGQTGLLTDATDSIRVGPSASVASVVRALVPRSMGVDFRVQLASDGQGFDVVIFALLDQEASYGGVTLPANPNRVTFDAPGDVDIERNVIVRSIDHQYSTVRVRGARIVVCCSLQYSAGSLDKHWTAAQETAYLNATGGTTGVEKDAIRAQQRYRSVYQELGAPQGWNLGAGSCAIKTNSDGEAVQFANHQTVVRRTLSWTPMREGFDYSTNPATDNNPSWKEPGYLPPQCWVFDSAIPSRYVPAQERGISLSVLQHEWGVRLYANPNHLMAKNHLDPATYATDRTPKFDWQDAPITLAFESDHRLELEASLPDGDGTALEIVDETAELWVLAPSTIIGVDENGVLQFSEGKIRELRNDSSRLRLLMAGAIARYLNPRGRARISFRGLLPWGDLVGHILVAVNESGDRHLIGAPITSVLWRGGESPSTVVSTGYAV